MSRFVLPIAVAALFLEFASIIWVGGRLGVFATLGLLVLSAFAGVSVLKAAGAGLLEAIRQPPRDMHFASREAASRFLMLAAGLLLIWPGFASDVVALVLLFPPVRSMIADRLAAKVTVQTAHWQAQSGAGPRPPSGSGGPLIIEGEAVEIDVSESDPPRER